MSPNRTNWIDHAKAIGIILVVYGHVARGIYNSNIDTPISFYTLTDSVIYSFHMPLFFFLSGLLFMSAFEKKGAGQLLLGKIDTIVYPYLIWSLLQGFVEVFLSRHANGSVTYSDVFALLWQPRAQFWFLYALFFVFVFAAILYSVLSRKYTLPIFVLSIALYLFAPGFTEQIIVLNFIAGHFVFFSLGIVFTSHLKIEHFSSSAALLAISAAFFAGQWFFHEQLGLRAGDKGIALLVLTCVSILFVVSFSARLSKMNIPFFAYIGASSMAIYLMHILAGSGTRVFLSKVLGVDSFAIHLLLGCLGGLIAPLLALAVIQYCGIPWIFSAPIGKFLTQAYTRVHKRIFD